MKRPKAKKRPPGEEAATEALAMDDTCRTNFFDKPTTRRRATQGRALASQAEGILAEADAKEGEERILLVKESLDKLSNALRADPYGPAPTYKMAVAYAMVGKKKCALDLLDRLQQLTRMPAVESEAERNVDRAMRDQAFEPFRKEADTALGR
ncbi:hypothetical protein [Haliangium ochraceum]|uniref:hypothetical protein n=1 Tax=Haliangium ochraceum TaxID=80816 RepID=UPI00019BB0A7|nr:hypothetical protein [Haliangium ochraceum]